jgi:hypothetical protein
MSNTRPNLPVEVEKTLRQWFELPNAHASGYETTALGSLMFQSAEVGKVVFTFEVKERHLNSHGTLHGGCVRELCVIGIELGIPHPMLSPPLSFLQVCGYLGRCGRLCGHRHGKLNN